MKGMNVELFVCSTLLVYTWTSSVPLKNWMLVAFLYRYLFTPWNGDIQNCSYIIEGTLSLLKYSMK